MITPDPTIIDVLEKALADARSGRTVAIAFAQIGQIDDDDGNREWLTSFGWPEGETAIGEKLLNAIAHSFNEVDEELVRERQAASPQAAS